MTVVEEKKVETEKEKKAKEAQNRIKDQEVLSGRVKLRAYDKYMSSIGMLNGTSCNFA